MSDPSAKPTPIGVININKPLPITSMTVCRIVRARLVAGGAPKRVKVGHGGALDPLASGVLVILVGKATRLCEHIMHAPKTYTTTIDLAHTSESHDLEQPKIAIGACEPPSAERVRRALERFVGVIEQTPPAHSAVKVGGFAAYKLARQGETPPIQPRPVRVDSLELLSYAWPMATVRIRCGRGFYVRSFAHDLGASLGVGGVLTELRRDAVGPFTLDHAIHLDDLGQPLTQDDVTPMSAEALDAMLANPSSGG